MEFINPNLKYDFIGKGRIAIAFSLLLIVGSFYMWFSTGDQKYGIDYLGGHEIIVKVPSTGNSGQIRKALNDAGMSTAIVQAFEKGSNEYSIRVGSGEGSSKEIRSGVERGLKSIFQDGFEIEKTDYVGPTIGKELREKALLAIIVSLIGMLIYIAYRFEFAFALGAVAALFHDVIICMGVYLLVGHLINVSTLAAALTIVGYSVNDTIIVFDRVREEMHSRNKFKLADLFNESISATLSRTIITSLLTFFSALALLLFGGGAIQDLSLFLVVGIITGTYSTIFIASPVALAWENRKAAKEKIGKQVTA